MNAGLSFVKTSLVRMCLIVFIAGGLVSVGVARTLYVSPVGTNDYTGYYSNWLGAATTISAAVSRASSGDSVFVTNTTYLLTSNIVVAAGITLRSWNNGVFDPTNTILDGQHLTRCLYINHTNALVAGFMITNGVGTGSVSSLYGGGVYIGSATGGGGCLSNCIVTGNSASNYGGGIYVYGSDTGRYAIVVDCEIRGNVMTDGSATYYLGGGGIFVYGGHVRNCTIAGNTSQRTDGYIKGGGGMYLSSHRDTSVTGCVISNNTAAYCGGGVYMAAFSGSFVSNIVSHNVAVNKNGGGLFLYSAPSNMVIADCTISDNTCGGDTGNTYGGGGASICFVATGDGGLITNCVIRDNTVTNTPQPGGGIYISSPKTNNLVVTDCTISGNRTLKGSSYGGGGIYAVGHALIKNCVISSNSNPDAAGYNGGVKMSLYTGLLQYPEIRNCLIYGNSASSRVGGLFVEGTVENCTIVNNTATTQGGGMRLWNSTFINTICYSNTATADPNWYQDGSHSFSYGCTTPTNGLTGENSITNAPLFTDENARNYRLLPPSPCINTGTNQLWMNTAVDLDGRPRLDRFSGRVDMGCYEHIRQGMIFIVR